MKNCPNCGAPITSTNCPYCGTVIYDFVNLDMTGKNPTWLRINMNGNVALVKAFPTSFETRFEPNTIEYTTVLGEQKAVYIGNPDITLSIEFTIMKDTAITL